MKIRSLQDLVAKMEPLKYGPDKFQILGEVVDALSLPIDGRTWSADPIFGNKEFHSYFSNVLRVHHATHEDKFKKKAFEFAIRGGCVALGRKARLTENSVMAGADLIIDGEKFSVKTEAERTISRTKIKISKLMEARWLREASTKPDRGSIAVQHVLGHLSNYDRVITLRAFDVPSLKSRTHIVYELWEIPLDSTLRLISKLDNAAFTAPTRNNSYSANVMAKDANGNFTSLFTLRLDGSVEKVTITGLRTDVCIRHASWSVPAMAAGAEDDQENVLADGK